MWVTSVRPVPEHLTCVPLPLFLSQVSAGFPSPAEDYSEGPLDLNKHIIRQPASTFFVRATGTSMIDAGIHSGDLLVVDRSVAVANGKVIIAVLNGELTVKRYFRRADGIYLVAANCNFVPFRVPDESAFEAWGVVTFVIHQV